MKYAGTIFELVGMTALCYGAYQLAPWLAWVIGGLAIILIGQALGGRPT
jgi:hypothetical protein